MTSSNTHVALITGASRGLGLAVARLLAQRGSRLVINARGAQALQAAAASLGGEPDVLALPGDVADPTHARRLVEIALAQFGRIDTLVNNASALGGSPLPALERLPLDAFEEVLRVNVVAPLHLIQLALPGMKARHTGTIVNVTSDAGVNAYPGWGGYGASKAALEHLSRVLAAELTGTNVRVLVIDPGDMDTQMHREAEPGEDLAHLPGPEAVAPAVVRLIFDPLTPSGRYQARALAEAAPA